MTVQPKTERPQPTAERPSVNRFGDGFAWLRTGAALLVFSALTVATMWPALSDIANTVMGSVQPGDATAGGVRLGWLLTVFAPFGGHSVYLGAPEGMPFWPFTYFTAVVWIIPQWVFAHLSGAVASWNLDLALGFVLDGLAMFGVVRWLTGRWWIGMVAGALYAFSPFHVEESYAHIGYVWSWIIPLILWACFWLASRPTVRRALVVGALVGAGAYLDPYYLLFGPMLAAVIGIVILAGARVLGIGRGLLLRLYVIAGAMALACIIPLLVLYVTAPASSRWLVSNRTALQTSRFQRAQLWEYFVPWENSPLWGRLTKSWIQRNLGVVPATETSLYLGAGVVALALGLVLWLVLSRGKDPFESPGSETSPLPLKFVGWTAVAGAVAMMLASFARIGPIPGFPLLVWRLEPLWRAFVRFDVVVDCLVIVAAALTLHLLASRRLPWAAVVCSAFALVDGTAILPWQSWSYAASTPAAYTWLARRDKGGIVAEYPMLPPDLPAYIDYSAYQVVHRQPLFNGALPGSRHADLERGLADITDPQTVPSLRTEGVRYVVLTRPLYDNPGRVPWGTIHLPGLRLVLNQQGVRLYRVLPGPSAVAALIVVNGFGVEHPFLPRVERWMGGSEADLGLNFFKQRQPVRVSFVARSYKQPKRVRSLRVYQAGHLMWQGIATESGTVVAFFTSSSAALVLRCSPGSVHVPGFLDRRSIDVIHLDVTPA